MAASQADERLLAQLRDRVGRRVTGWRPGAEVVSVSPLTGGTSSLTFLVGLAGVAAGETPVVLKLAPPGLAPVRNRDVLRQARLQQALQGPGRRLAPDVLFTDPGDPPAVPPFMVMSLVPGECVEPVLCADAERPPAAQVRARFLDAVQVLARLHAIDPAGAGLGGEPAVGLAAEVDRWTRAFVTLPAGLAGDYQRAASALRASLPAALPLAVNHGDFRLGNTLCTGERVSRASTWPG
jgi:aminoglycoside phosphotransferase (APT) family kinase protein